MTWWGLVTRYAAFAAVATLANLATQRAILLSGSTALHLAAAMAGGTAIGLLIKYALDRRFIFGDRGTGWRHHGQRFGRYTATGLATTALFWATEAGFWLIWQTDAMRELGAVAGLTLGYMLKYRLDRRFVFARRHDSGGAPENPTGPRQAAGAWS